MSANDLTSSADLTGHDKGTGALRTRRPLFVDYLPPCNDACPAGENEHRDCRAMPSYALQDIQSIHVRQAEVENNDVRRFDVDNV